MPRGLRRFAAAAVFLVPFALLAQGCAARREPPRPRPAPGYDARVDGLGAVDTTRLRGRRIVLDPGHGGRFRGSLGVNGLTEAEANLRVALQLRDLLEARGALVLMTRSDDRDFLTPADSSLRADLSERMRIANGFDPDLFVSIHHNADAGGAHDVNETQTYYTLGDEGPSLDAAESVHRFLVRNLGIRVHKILPGNYYVLRNANAPALLTESSYITNPDVEAKLALPEKQRLEAEALYLGIAHFFARGAPVIEAFRLTGVAGGAPDSALDVAAPGFEARVAGAFDEATLRLDGAVVPLVRDGARLSARPAGVLRAGDHAAVLEVRRAGAGAARPARMRFGIVRRVTGVSAAAWPGSAPRAGAALAVRLSLEDRYGEAVPDSIPLHVTWDGGDTTIVHAGGAAWVYPRGARPGPYALDVERPDPPGGRWRTALTLAPVDDSLWCGFVSAREADGLRPLEGAPGTREPERRVAWLNRDGYAALPAASGGLPRVPRLAGYRALPGDSAAPAFVAIASGALHSRRIVLDPDGGGDASGGTGPSGTRAAHVNLRIARILRGFLEAAGADVRLTRDGDFALSEVERVQISEAFGAERYLRIGHRPEPPRLGHFFSSTAGRAWAGRTAAALARMGYAPPAIADDAQYPLQQTSCPALYVSVARIDAAAAEDALFAPGGLRREAYALYLGFLREWAPEAAFPLDSVFVRDGAGAPVPGAAVTLGDALMLETDPDGRVRFARTEPGPLDAAVVDPRVTARAILLDSSPGAILTGPVGRP